MSHIKKIVIYILLLLPLLISAQEIDISQEINHSILTQASLYFDRENSLSIEEIIAQDSFEPSQRSYINTGVEDVTIWVKLNLTNSSQKPIKKLLILTSPILEEIALFDPDNLSTPQLKGVAHLTKEHHTIFPYYTIMLNAKQHKTYYIRLKNRWTPLAFGIKIKEEQNYFEEDKKEQIIKAMLLAMILVMTLYTLMLGIYTYDQGYFYYAFYLLTLLYQQSTYLGLAQLYLPLYYSVNIEIKLPVTEVSLVIISASLFASSFLKTHTIPILHYIYRGFILVAILQILILNIPTLYNLGIVLVTSTLLIIFNLVASIVSYLNGNRQARLFIVGFGVVFFAYAMIIADALGLSSFIQHFPNTLIWGTVFEALILSLAFTDRYAILAKAKEEVDQRILQEAQSREELIKQEVIKKTSQLNHALKAKELLLKEVHHRVKNNLQIILSMVRLQGDRNQNRELFVNLENRINAISKTYNLLLPEDNLDAIDMEEYIDSLMLDIHETMCYANCNIQIETDIQATLPLRESVYIGLIINELVTNAYKYAFCNQEHGTITITLRQINQHYTLIIKDTGEGFVYNKENDSLGLKLIHTLIHEQLRGTIEMSTQGSTCYTIKFKI
jgi:two-component sensor histidine kinase